MWKLHDNPVTPLTTVLHGSIFSIWVSNQSPTESLTRNFHQKSYPFALPSLTLYSIKPARSFSIILSLLKNLYDMKITRKNKIF